MTLLEGDFSNSDNNKFIRKNQTCQIYSFIEGLTTILRNNEPTERAESRVSPYVGRFCVCQDQTNVHQSCLPLGSLLLSL